MTEFKVGDYVSRTVGPPKAGTVTAIIVPIPKGPVRLRIRTPAGEIYEIPAGLVSHYGQPKGDSHA